MESAQPALFYERIEDALDAVINACGGRKKMAAELWPDKAQRDAHNLIDACLNPERREKLDPAQVLYILKRGREIEFHAAKYWLDAELGYEQGRPISPQDEAARLQRQVIEAAAVLKDSISKLERLTSPALSRVA